MPDFKPRRAKGFKAIGFTTFEGEQRELKADGKGLFHPQTTEDERALDGYDLPVAAAPKKAAPAKKAAGAKKTSSGKAKKSTPASAPAKPAPASAVTEVHGPGAKPDGGND